MFGHTGAPKEVGMIFVSDTFDDISFLYLFWFSLHIISWVFFGPDPACNFLDGVENISFIFVFS